MLTCACDRTAIFIKDGQVFRPRYVAGGDDDVSQFALHQDNPIVRLVAEDRSPLIENSPQERPGIRTISRIAGITSFALVPVFDGHDLVGLFTVERLDGEIDLDEPTVEVVEAIGSAVSHRLISHRLEQERRKTLASELMTEQRNRRRIANHLHDGPHQALMSLAMRLRLLADAEHEEQTDQLLGLTVDAESARDDLRAMIIDLDSLVGHASLTTALRSLLDVNAEAASWRTDFQIEGQIDTVPAEIAFTLERIVQEALANVRQHAAADRVSIYVDRRPDVIAIEVVDDGRGIESTGGSAHLAGRGIHAMNERARVVNGSLEIRESVGGGTTIAVRLPVGDGPRDGDSAIRRA